MSQMHLCRYTETMAIHHVPWVFQGGGYFLFTMGTTAPQFVFLQGNFAGLIWMFALCSFLCSFVPCCIVGYIWQPWRFNATLISNLIIQISKHPSKQSDGVRVWYQVAYEVWINLLKHLQVVFYDNTPSLWGEACKGRSGAATALFSPII